MTNKQIIKELEDRDITYSIEGEFISCNINTLAQFIQIMIVRNEFGLRCDNCDCKYNGIPSLSQLCDDCQKEVEN